MQRPAEVAPGGGRGGGGEAAARGRAWLRRALGCTVRAVSGAVCAGRWPSALRGPLVAPPLSHFGFGLGTPLHQ